MNNFKYRVLRIEPNASCDNLIEPNSSFLSMSHQLYQVHSSKSFVGNVSFRDNSNDSQSSFDRPISRVIHIDTNDHDYDPVDNLAEKA